ncbi:MAG: hypothetical protein ACT4O0_07560 [Pseudonocardia sp.]
MTRTPARRGPTARRATLGSAAVATTAALAVLLTGSGGEPAPAAATVQRSSVVDNVVASGTLTALASQSLSFPVAAPVKEIKVKVGDQVSVGQVLAIVDDFVPRQQLNQELAELRQQQIELNKIINGTSLSSAQISLDQARKVFAATERTTEAGRRSNASATGRAETQLRFSRRQREEAEQRLRRCRSAPRTTTATPESVTADATDGSADPSAPPTSTGRTSSSSIVQASDCSDEQDAVTGADRQIVSDQTSLEAARQREKTDAAQARLTMENVRQSVLSAQNAVAAERVNRPAAIASQRELVKISGIQVALAQRELDNTQLRAPAAGTVSAINARVGDLVGPSVASASLAPGGAATLPGAPATAAPFTEPLGTAAAGGPFMVLSNLDTFQVVVPFTEADAVRIGVNRPAKVSFEAIPGLVREGTVLSLAPSATAVDGAAAYQATITLTGSDPRLRDGLTASASVEVKAAHNVLTVPNEAVQRQDDATIVIVAGPSGEPLQIRFQAGLAGEERTEVVAGLAEGQRVLITPGRSLPAANRTDR